MLAAKHAYEIDTCCSACLDICNVLAASAPGAFKLSNVPCVPLDREWDDAAVAVYFGFNEADIPNNACLASTGIFKLLFWAVHMQMLVSYTYLVIH